LMNVRPDRCLIVGDRDDRDGEAARRGGFLFLKKVSNRRQPKMLEFRHYAELIHEFDAIRPAHLVSASTKALQ
jgi:FMN phosphatase YigB (HAD superfamily)